MVLLVAVLLGSAVSICVLIPCRVAGYVYEFMSELLKEFIYQGRDSKVKELLLRDVEVLEKGGYLDVVRRGRVVKALKILIKRL